MQMEQLHMSPQVWTPRPLGRNEKRFRGGLVFKAHRLLYHSTLGSRVIKKKKKKKKDQIHMSPQVPHARLENPCEA